MPPKAHRTRRVTARESEAAAELARGNIRLQRWLLGILRLPGPSRSELLRALASQPAELREIRLAQLLVGGLAPFQRAVLGALNVLRQAAPRQVVEALALPLCADAAALEETLAHSERLGLLEVGSRPGGTGRDHRHYCVSEVVRPELPIREPDLALSEAGRAAEAWHAQLRSGPQADDADLLELLRLARLGRKRDIALPWLQVLVERWINAGRRAEALVEVEAAANVFGEDYRILAAEGRIRLHAGQGSEAQALLAKAMRLCPPAEVRERARTGGFLADALAARGQLDEAMRLCREDLLPAFRRLGDEHELCVTWGRIADLLAGRGELDEALRILRQQLLPAFQQRGDVHSAAVVQGRIADVLAGRGQFEEALRLLREEQLPVFRRLGDAREAAVTQAKMAEIRLVRGEVEEAERLFREELLPAFERLGDVRAQAVIQGKIADILTARGQLDEALCIRREDVLPAFRRLGDVRELAIAQGKIADVLASRGQIEEALRIWRDELLPAFQRLGDVRELAFTHGKIADVLVARGQSDEALRILQAELLPRFERLGDLRSRAVTQGKVADVLAGADRLDEALRLRREEQIPVFERLGDLRGQIAASAMIARDLAARGRPEDRAEVSARLLSAFQAARAHGLADATQILRLAEHVFGHLPDEYR